jgi:hypothetical protein
MKKLEHPECSYFLCVHAQCSKKSQPKLRHDAAILRKPRKQQLYSAQNFAFFIYLSRHMKLTAALYTNKKRHTLGLAGKNCQMF